MEAYKYLFIENSSRLLDYHKATVLEIGCGSGDMLKEIANRYSPLYIVGIDNNLNMWSTIPCKKENWEITAGDSAHLRYPDNHFDIVISVGVFEHLLDLKGSLAEIKRVLKPHGKLYTEFSPIWSSIIGHHYNFWIEKDAELLPPWGHLWMSPSEIVECLEPKIGRECALQACYDIYHGNQLNRLKRNDYYNLFLNCGLWIRELKEHVSFSRMVHFNRTNYDLTKEIYDKLSYIRLEELAVLGFTVLFEKY